ncbi:hypothetical protein Pan97_18960 [Bremerella volcania]|uniref:Uncharacterized protein n=1 Tax=Bremerella volcania TaxID=2527984 RepID=A0A518C6N5_9BACT|nr:hypothetical protein [Bremerella volcania]QDU74877.1 hypothetical protein Pan97_18960 [Bremerella volcania]
MSVLKWMCSASLVMGLMVFSIGCSSKTAEPPVENTSEPEISMPAEGEAPAEEAAPAAEEKPDAAAEEEKPAEE